MEVVTLRVLLIICVLVMLMRVSGDAEQYIEINGKRYSHIVDPRTGLGLTDRIAVTVIAPDGVTSDGLATAISVLGPRGGRTLGSTFPGVSVHIRTAK